MRILLFGGTFDPPHNGHMHNLKHAIDFVKPQKVIVMPAGIPPHKSASKTKANLRLKMCECFLELANNKNNFDITISDWEINCAKNGEANYTINTLNMLSEKYQGADLFLTVGSDMLLNFKIWKNWQEILQKVVLVVQTRKLGNESALKQKMKELDPSGKRIILNDINALEMDSTTLRKMLKQRQDCTGFLPADALKVITEEQLYI